jgi:hypothetical protein
MTRRSQLVPSRVRSSSVRRGAGGRSPDGAAWSAALLPALAGRRRLAARLVTPSLPWPEPPPGLEWLFESP